jgi:hypothetical protein
MSILKRKFNPEDDLGFGYQPVLKNQPLILQDGSVNVKRKGLPFFRPYDNYHKLITMSWSKFWLLILACYCAAHNAAAHDTAGERYILVNLRRIWIEIIFNILRKSGHIKSLSRVGVNTQVP